MSEHNGIATRDEGDAATDRFDILFENASTYLNDEDCKAIEEAYLFAKGAHEGQFRKSGEPFIMHPVEVAIILSDLRMDSDTLRAAVLHDTVEDTEYTLEDVRQKFGDTVAELVDGVTKINSLEIESLSHAQVNNLRKMLMAMSNDIRVIVIKLADRLHNMRTLMALREDRRIFKARETMEIYAPLANRLGMGSIKWELEDLSFFYLEPAKYQQVQKMVNETREARERYLAQAMDALREELDRVGLENAKIYGRPKHLYSIYQKMKKKDKGFSEIYDLIGLRIIVDSIPECYSSLGAVHNLWHPIPGRFKDYIAMPKFNMYQSLHTTVIGPAARPLEIQIRTEEMHRMNEYGVAAHWRYKEGASKDRAARSFDEKLTWLREMLDWQQETNDPQEFMESLKVDLFESEVFCFTPKGEVISLRARSTPLDFAYAIHTEVGNHCVGAKVNGSIVPLTYTLQMGDRVEILTQKNASPSRDWLSIVNTPRARSKIRAYFAKITRNDDLERGRDYIVREARKNGVTLSSGKMAPAFAEVAASLNYKGADDMYIAVGAGNLSPKQVMHRALRILNKTSAEESAPAPSTIEHVALSNVTPQAAGKRKKPAHNKTGVIVKGLDDVFVRLSHCCNPLPGDEIIGFITRGRGVSVHRADCPNADDLRRNPERIIEVAWEGEIEAVYQVEIYIEAIDRLRLLQGIVMFLADSGVNIVSCTTTTHKDDIVEMRFVFEVSDLAVVNRILSDVKHIDGVFGASRVLPSKQGAASAGGAKG